MIAITSVVKGIYHRRFGVCHAVTVFVVNFDFGTDGVEVRERVLLGPFHDGVPARWWVVNHPTAILVNVSKAHGVGALDPMFLLAAAAIRVLELPVYVLELLGHVSACLEVDTLPRADPAVDVLQRLGEEGTHRSAGSLGLGKLAAVDASDADAVSGSRRGALGWLLLNVQNKDFQEFRTNKAMEAVELLAVVGHG